MAGEAVLEELLRRFPGGPDDDRFLEELARILAEPFAGGFEAADRAVGGAIQFGPAEPRAIAWARGRAAQLLTWGDETTKELIRALVARQLEAGITIQDLTKDIMQEFGGMAEYRAERIARTETGFAFNQGAIARYRQAEVRYVKVFDGPGCLPKGHDDDAGLPDLELRGLQSGVQANGQVWTLDEAEANPLGHPNCVRAFAALIEAPAEAAQEA